MLSKYKIKNFGGAEFNGFWERECHWSFPKRERIFWNIMLIIKKKVHCDNDKKWGFCNKLLKIKNTSIIKIVGHCIFTAFKYFVEISF